SRHDPLDNEAPPGDVPPVVVPRWVQVVFVLLAALALYSLARAAGQVLLIFVIAAIIALILNPGVALIQRLHVPRGLAVLTVYITFFLTVGGVGVLLSTPISNQVQALNRDLPTLTTSANRTLADVQRSFDDAGVHVQIVKPGKTALQSLQDQLAKSSSSIVSFTGDLLTTLVKTGFGLILVFVLSVYMLLYGKEIGALVRSAMPDGDGSPEDDYPMRIQRAVSGYVRGQILFSTAMGTGAGVGLWILGLVGVFPDGGRYAVAFGVFFGLMEMIPFVGPVLGAIPPILVALFQDPLTAVWVMLLFIGLQQIEGHVVAPQIFGHTLRINPLLVIFALAVGGEIYGLLGALIALPVAAVVRETAVYLRRHLVLEQWDTRRPRPGPSAASSG
ncbi:MAG TPA: AI-2E family transporter, partial [Solirubrobacteraceae bacterium]|nr:AI-2E family transporter [Solirubrobacteraceae bacterium]